MSGKSHSARASYCDSFIESEAKKHKSGVEMNESDEIDADLYRYSLRFHLDNY